MRRTVLETAVEHGFAHRTAHVEFNLCQLSEDVEGPNRVARLADSETIDGWLKVETSIFLSSLRKLSRLH